MYDAAVPPSLHAIARARHLLARVQAAGVPALLEQQLVPGMFDAGTQLRTVGIFALRATYPLCGQDWPRDMLTGDFPPGPTGLDARLGVASEQVMRLTRADFDGAAESQINHIAGDAELTQRGQEYLHLFALPNLWFHLSMAYAILRQSGLEIGKADYDGFHAYERGFSFVP
ncbi:DUF1993 family protein [Alphaproteobacteria bacterium GH1-50]|uniref:DUF1993 family protein n=1 Tax=Kangsaoukella pontilimi TaxID=2691042 RepID=A0A7C9N1D1_9RHOB|nr:DUF1993 family protein [Kangsaoukella pontilimi]MXQ08658.1 DUF1993 family protein [Kangsaoukella pontilimi]